MFVCDKKKKKTASAIESGTNFCLFVLLKWYQSNESSIDNYNNIIYNNNYTHNHPNVNDIELPKKKTTKIKQTKTRWYITNNTHIYVIESSCLCQNMIKK